MHRPGLWSRAGVGALLALGGVAAVGIAGVDAHAGNLQIGIAWDDTAAGRSFAAAIDATRPGVFVAPPIEVPGDGVLRHAFGELFHVSRSAGVITRIEVSGWRVVGSHSFAPSAELRDVAVTDPSTAYVADRAGTALLRLNPGTGTVVPAVDLTPLGVAPNVLSPERMLVHEGRLYLQLRRPQGLGQTSLIAVIDLASESLVDADPGVPGVQGIALAGTEPRHKMQVIPGTRRLMVSATGALLDDGGIETIDLDTLGSEGIVLSDIGELGVNDFGPFVMLDSDFGWFSGATSIVPSSHLHSFHISDPQPSIAVGNEIFFNAPHLVFDPGTHRIFWPIPDGMRFYDATTGVEDAASPALLLSGTTTDVEPIPLPSEVPAFGRAAWALALLLLAAAGAIATAGPRPGPRA